VTQVQAGMTALGRQVQSGELSYDEAQSQIEKLLSKYDPWKYVNTLAVDKDQLVDLSCGALHHSWEEDSARAPLGNVLYELQSEAMDDVSTFRNFDKGKMARDGSIRQVHIKEYFDIIDRTPEVNDPATHIRKPQTKSQSSAYRLDGLLETPYYSLDKITFLTSSASFDDNPGTFKHLFVKTGRVEITAGGQAITVGTGHSCFVPAGARGYTVKNLADLTEVLVSF
jgi:mannose-6-phosphate isomerase class I